MKVFKTIIGVLAALWTVAHLVEALVNGLPTQGQFAVSAWMGKIVAIVIGVIVMIVCFRPAKKVENEG